MKKKMIKKDLPKVGTPRVFSFTATGAIKTKEGSLKKKFKKILAKDKAKHNLKKKMRAERREYMKKYGELR